MTSYEPSEDELHGKMLELRELFAETCKTKIDDYCECDVKKFNEDDVYCKKFVLHNLGYVRRAHKMAQLSLKWRKDFGTNDIKVSNVRDEVLKIGGVFNVGFDKEGHENVYLILRLFMIKELDLDELRRYTVFWFETMANKEGKKQINFIINTEGAGLSNVDMGVLQFLKDLFITYYPYFAKRILVFQLPWLFNAIWTIIKGWLNPEHVKRIHFVNRESIKEFIDDENLIDSMGGANPYVYNYEYYKNLALKE